jgi:hypothetical protein
MAVFPAAAFGKMLPRKRGGIFFYALHSSRSAAGEAALHIWFYQIIINWYF